MDRRVKERLVGATILVVLIVLIVPELLSGPKRLVLAPPPVLVGQAVGPAEPVRNVTVDLATSKATPAEEAPAASAASSTAGTPSAATISGEATPGVAAPGETASGGMAAGGEAASGEAAPSEAVSGVVTGQPATGAATPGMATPRVPALGDRARAGPGHTAAAPPTITTLRAQQPAAPALENEASPPKSASIKSKPRTVREAAPEDTSRHNWAVQLGSFASRANAEKLVRQLKAHESSAYVSSSGKGPSLRYRVRIGPLADRGAAERIQLKLRKEGLSASLIPP